MEDYQKRILDMQEFYVSSLKKLDVPDRVKAKILLQELRAYPLWRDFSDWHRKGRFILDRDKYGEIVHDEELRISEKLYNKNLVHLIIHSEQINKMIISITKKGESLIEKRMVLELD